MVDLGSIGAELRRLRLRQGLNVREVAARADCSFQMVSALENASVHNPSVRTLEAVAASLGAGVEVRIVTPSEGAALPPPPDAELLKLIRDMTEVWPQLGPRDRRTLRAMLESMSQPG